MACLIGFFVFTLSAYENRHGLRNAIQLRNSHYKIEKFANAKGDFNLTIIRNWGKLSPQTFSIAMESEAPLMRVIRDGNMRYMVADEKGEVGAVLSGKFKKSMESGEDAPCVGDWVQVQSRPDSNEDVVIETIMPRETCLRRKNAGTGMDIQNMAANVDTVFICTSINDDLNPRRIERFGIIASGSGADTVIVLTKADLVDDPKSIADELQKRLGNTLVLTVNSSDEDGYSSVKDLMRPHKTYALIGSSGVGKSTLINGLMGEEIMHTSAVRDDDKGRHTTTHRQMLRTPDGHILIDMPGVREVQLYSDTNALNLAFEDISDLADRCKFGDCTHESEPGCAVNKAIDSGEIDPDRLMNYKKMLREMDAYWKKKGHGKYKSKRKR